MAASINQNTDNAKQTEKLALQAVENIKVANDSVINTLHDMKMIITKISVIKEIAEKTRLVSCKMQPSKQPVQANRVKVLQLLQQKFANLPNIVSKLQKKSMIFLLQAFSRPINRVNY